MNWAEAGKCSSEGRAVRAVLGEARGYEAVPNQSPVFNHEPG